MELKWDVLDNLLSGELDTDDLSLACKDELQKFLGTHNFGIFSDDSLEQLAGIFELSIKPAYEEGTGEKIPNIFHVIKLDEEQVEENGQR